MDKLIIGFIYILIVCFTPTAWTVPKEQDRAILEGTETNLLPNPGFEAQNAGWTASGSSVLTTSTANPIKGNISARWDPSATGEFLDSELLQIEGGFVGDRCQMEFKYRWPTGVTGEIKAVLRQFDDSEATESDVASIDLTPTSGDLNSIVQLPMIDCPDDPADSYRFRLESTANATTITIDKAFMGSGRNTFQLSQTTLVTTAFYATTSSCSWSRTSASFGDFGVDVDCPSITVGFSTQVVDTTDIDLPHLVFTNLIPGIYQAKALFRTLGGSGGQAVGYRIETVDSNVTKLAQPGSGQSTPSVDGTHATAYLTFRVDTAGTVTLKMQGFNSAAGTVSLFNADNTSNLAFEVIKYPENSAEAITLETVGEYWDVNIGGTNVDLGTANVADYAEMTNSGLDMIINTNKGSKTAEIPCSGTNPSTGLTCSVGNESPGIVIDISTAGRYEACFYFGHATDANASGTVQTVFQLVETPNNALTILQEGDTRLPSSIDNDSSASHGGIIPVSICGTFVFNSVGQKTIRLFYEQLVAATVTTSLVVIDRVGNAGQRDMHITVEKKDQQFPIPIFTDLTTSLDKKLDFEIPSGSAMCAFRMSTVTDTITIDSGACAGSVADNGTGDSTITFVTAFSAFPICTCSVNQIAGNKFCVISQSNSTTRVGLLTDDGVAADDDVWIICVGAK